MTSDVGTAKTAGGGHPPAIELRDINKHFGPVHANKDISMTVPKGTIHGIIGENGAGKSTLMSILYGFYEADSGEIHVNGQRTKIDNSDDAIAVGIGMVHQHFMLVDVFTVLENIILGVEGGATLKHGEAAARSALEALEEEYQLEVPLDAITGELPVGIQQRVEILKALYRGADILILDEPTGVLTPQEADQLFRILGTLREQGKTVILITHKLREIMAITDNVTVMRQGEVVANVATKDTDREQLAELMVGRKVLLRVDKEPATPGDTLLAVENLDVFDSLGVRRVKDVSFSVHSGEIVGIAGVSGNGQSELLAALSGTMHPKSGSIAIAGTDLTQMSGFDASTTRALGLGHVPEDRHHEGLVTGFTANENAVLGYHRSSDYNGSLFMNGNAVISTCERYMADFDVRPPNPMLKAANFSGGNQQKLIVAREMEQHPKVLLVGQPTRGVDIGAIEFIHRRLIAMRDAGSAVLLVSVELDEVMSLSDRILVMFDGHIVGEIAAADATEQKLGLMMAGISPDEAESSATAEAAVESA
ncbi:MAG: ABC transporter ATP-binding protein [Pseudomonadota bacterium]